jgi:hypothetical protein
VLSLERLPVDGVSLQIGNVLMPWCKAVSAGLTEIPIISAEGLRDFAASIRALNAASSPRLDCPTWPKTATLVGLKSVSLLSVIQISNNLGRGTQSEANYHSARNNKPEWLIDKI